MMRAADVKEAQQILSSLAWCDKMLTAKPQDNTPVFLPVMVESGRTTQVGENVALPVAAREAAFRIWREGVVQQRAALVRRANQIGLSL